jgi:hypothetical protein
MTKHDNRKKKRISERLTTLEQRVMELGLNQMVIISYLQEVAKHLGLDITKAVETNDLYLKYFKVPPPPVVEPMEEETDDSS